MKCPRDSAAMTFIDDGTHMRNRCPDCSGLLLDEAEVAAALGQRRKPDAARIAALPESKVKCPRDGKPMRALEHNGIELDLCAGCGSLWFDAGELEKVSARKSKVARNAAAAAALAGGAAAAAAVAASPAQSSTLGNVAGGVGEFVGEVATDGAIEVVFELVGEVLGALF